MATTTRDDPWLQPSSDPWSQPSVSEQRFFERRDSAPPRESWSSDTDLSFESESSVTTTSPRRVAAARVIGFVGVLGVIALAVAAFAPRMPLVTSKFAAFANRVGLPWDPTLEPGPMPLPLDRATNIAPLQEAALNTRTIDELPQSEASPVATLEASAATPLETIVRDEAKQAPVSQTAATVSSDERSPRAAVASRKPVLTPEDIELREQRYENWLKEEGLERVH